MGSNRMEGKVLLGVTAMGQYVGGAGMLRLKSCPKCKGDVILSNKDKHGWYEQCLQCGYLHDLETIVQVEKQPVEVQGRAMASRPKHKLS